MALDTQIDNVVPLAQESENPAEDFQSKMIEWDKARVHLQRLVNDWSSEIEETDKRRKERKVEIDVEAARQEGKLEEDETMVPIRVIDSNITREQPAYVNYLKNSRRIAIFESLDDPNQDCDLLEQEFTKKASYTAWEVPHFKCIDGSAAHGWDAIELVYDTDKPGNFSLEQIGHDKLYFPCSAIDIQASPRIIRAYDVTISQLQTWVKKYGFDAEQVNILMQARKDGSKDAETIRIHKCFYKIDGVVMIAWFCLTNGVKDWLKAPQPHYIGIDEEVMDPITQQPTGEWKPKTLEVYPIFILCYKLNEEAEIMSARGRSFLDSFKQEAQTAMWSAFINGMNRASNIYASPTIEDGTGTALKEIEGIKMVPNRFYNKPINFWSPPYPDALFIKALQFADTQNSSETNQVNFAAMNREDSRKTATEIDASAQQQQLLNSVQLTLFSTFIRQIYALAWLVVQSQALQNKIQFLLVPQQIPVTNPMQPGMPVINPQTQQPMTRTIFTNNVQIISQRYVIRAAGDVDVIAKQEQLTKMRMDWPVISTTALKDVFLMDYVRLAYPESAQKYVLALQEGSQMNQMKSMIMQLTTVLDGALKDSPSMQTLSMQEKGDISRMMEQAQAMGGANVPTSSSEMPTALQEPEQPQEQQTATAQ